MKKIIIFFVIFISVNQSKSQVLNVSQVIQEQNQWCWAGVSACILDYYCAPTAQCTIAEYTRTVETFSDISFGSTDCCVSPSSCNNWNYNWGGLGSIQDILVHFANISNYGVGSLLTQVNITSDIQNNRVFVIRWGWDAGGGHFLVGHGLIGNNMYYMDPWYGEGLKIADYSWVCSGGGHTWTHTNQLSVSPYSDPPANAGTISGTATVCQGQTSVTYTVPAIANATSYIWTLPSGATGTSTTNSISVNYGTSAVSGNITVKGNNLCDVGTASSLAITVNPVYAFNENYNICNGDTYNWHGNDYTTANTYTANYTSTNGCDSIYTLHLAVNSVYSFTENHSICNGDTYNWHGTNYTSANTYTANYTNINGCDSIYTLNLSVTTVDTSLTISEPTINANAIGATYQWLDCYNAFAIISGAIFQSYTASANGNYAVAITQGACSDTSACVQIITIGMGSLQTEGFSIYPNPVTNELIIENMGNKEKIYFEILNIIGQVVFKGKLVEKAVVQTTNFEQGVYIIKLTNGKYFEFKKFIKE